MERSWRTQAGLWTALLVAALSALVIPGCGQRVQSPRSAVSVEPSVVSSEPAPSTAGTSAVSGGEGTTVSKPGPKPASAPRVSSGPIVQSAQGDPLRVALMDAARAGLRAKPQGTCVLQRVRSDIPDTIREVRDYAKELHVVGEANLSDLTVRVTSLEQENSLLREPLATIETFLAVSGSTAVAAETRQHQPMMQATLPEGGGVE